MASHMVTLTASAPSCQYIFLSLCLGGGLQAVLQDLLAVQASHTAASACARTLAESALFTNFVDLLPFDVAYIRT